MFVKVGVATLLVAVWLSASVAKCPIQDAPICGGAWNQSHCSTYQAVKKKCPYMCGICSDDQRPECNKASNCHKSPAGCMYVGAQASKAKCSTYGNKGADRAICSVAYTCLRCRQYGHVKTRHCPVMCGYCPPKCSGLVCLNGGTMDVAKCKCKCQTMYTGCKCENKNCPQIDASTCYPDRDKGLCKTDWEVKYRCPYMCGLC